MKSCSISLITEEMQSKTTMISHLLEWLLSKREEITNSDVNVEEKEHLDAVGENVNRHNHNRKQYEGSSKN